MNLPCPAVIYVPGSGVHRCVLTDNHSLHQVIARLPEESGKPGRPRIVERPVTFRTLLSSWQLLRLP